MTEPEAPQSPPPPPPATPTPAEGGGSENKGLMIALSYLWLLALVPLLVEKDDAEVQWHAKHGLVLMVAEVILSVGLMIVGMLLGPFACVLGILQLFIFLGIIVVHILCIVKGVGGERFVIPGITPYADKF